MKSMIRKIADSKRAYAIVLNAHCKSATTRYAIYVEMEDGLTTLWPNENETLLPMQVYNNLPQYPAYHFTVSGYQFSHFGEIKRMLKKINPSIECFVLRGWFPSDN
jgi:hypothetical protein